MSQFHFLRPEWFALVLPLLLCLWMLFKHKQRSDWQSIIPEHLAKALFSEQAKAGKNWLLPIFIVYWLCCTVALAGPTWEKIEKPVFKAQLANVIVMDMSLSMRSTDVSPDRLTKSKFKAIDLANSLGDGEVGLVAYAGDAYAISPLTQDPRNIAALIPSLSPEIMPVMGSYPLLGLELAADLMRQAGYLSGQIYWFTDGIEQDDMDELRKFSSSTPYQINILGFGTQTGAPIKLADGTLMKDQTGRIVMPRLTKAPLRDLAKVSGGLYQPMTPNDLDIKNLAARATLKEAREPIENGENSVTGDDWQEFGPYLVLFAMPAFLFLFRRGVFLSIMFASGLVLPSIYTGQASAAQTSPSMGSVTKNNTVSSPERFERPLSVFKTHDQLAQEAYSQEQYEAAMDLFDNSQWKASAAYKAGDYETALSLFSQDPSVDGIYNKANSLAQLGQLEDALAAYHEVLIQQPDHANALHNKEVIEKALQQQKQNQQQQQQEQSQQEKKEQENSEQQGSESTEQQKSEQQEGDQQDSEQKSEQNESQPSEQAQSQQSEQTSNSEQESEQQSAQQQAQQQQQQQAENSETEQNAKTAKTLTPEEIAEQEQQQKIQQLLRKVDDDPSILIRNKMILESRRRAQERRLPKGVKKSW